jgi:hypothetical protein
MNAAQAKDFDFASPSIPESQIDKFVIVRVYPLDRSPNLKGQRPVQIFGSEGRRVLEIPYTPVSHAAPPTIRAYLGEAVAGHCATWRERVRSRPKQPKVSPRTSASNGTGRSTPARIVKITCVEGSNQFVMRP